MLAVYGAGGFAVQIFGMLEAVSKAGESVCFVDDRRAGQALFGVPIRNPEDLDGDADFAIAVSDPTTRERIAARLPRFRELRAASAIVSPHASIGPGAILCDNTIVEPGVRIGQHFHSNIYSYVAHDCVIGDFVTFAPKVACNGNVHIHDRAYIGTGAMFIQGRAGRPLVVGEGAFVGMGAVVTTSVEPYTVVAGNPAKPISKIKPPA